MKPYNPCKMAKIIKEVTVGLIENEHLIPISEILYTMVTFLRVFKLLSRKYGFEANFSKV